MNFSCEGNRNVDCVFFKLVGTTDLTGGKSIFGHTVISLFKIQLAGKFNGTISPINTNIACSLPTTPPLTIPTTPNTTTIPITTSTTDQPGSDDNYIIIGSALGISLLLCFIIILCIVICLLHKRNHDSHTPPLSYGHHVPGVEI